ncbi:MAG: response regulator [Candidatus Thiodiazotropha sp. (ex Dulcina madagascariensis)]|nr:response regulator [Candidatus Thiodiazotropha sp. (ex Dulcina madagascariensis)]
MNILIAEDNRMIQVLNAELMNNWGFEFDMASNGIEAVEFARRNGEKYDLCLMDIEMPRMNGIEAARKIRESQSYFPIMALTADSGYKKACFTAGIDDFLQKPCFPGQLFRIIKELTVKLISVDINDEDVSITRVTPMNSEELQELRDLKKQGLTKLKLVGLGHAFVVHRNIQNKISHDLIGENKELSEFIDRSPSEPGRCHLYKANLHVTKDLFLPEELEEAIRDENEIAMRFDSVSDVKISDKNA